MVILENAKPNFARLSDSNDWPSQRTTDHEDFVAAEFLQDLYQSKPEDAAEKHLCAGAESVLMEHIARAYEKQDAGTNPRRPRISARDLLSDAERMLTRTSGGLSLYERLQRDP